MAEKTDDRGGLLKVTLEFENGTMWVEGENALLWQKFVGSMEALYMSRGWPMEPIPWSYEVKAPSQTAAAPMPTRPPKGPKTGRKGGKGGKKNKQRSNAPVS